MTKRLDLREYQQNVLNRLQHPEAAGSHASTLGFEAGGSRWLVNMNDIGEVLPLPPLTHVPLTKSWYCGVANVRGTLYSISDFAAFIGGPQTPRSAQSRVLLTSPQLAANAGLLVDQVLGLRDAANWPREETADGVSYRDEQGQIWRQLDVAGLLQRPEFLQIGS